MPKPRSLPRDSKVEFVASAWQDRPHKPSTEQLQQQGTEYVPMVATPDQRAQAAQQQLQQAQPSSMPTAQQQAGAPSAWMDRKGSGMPVQGRGGAEEQPSVSHAAPPQDATQAGEGSDVTEGDEGGQGQADGDGASSMEGMQGKSQPVHHDSEAAAANGVSAGGQDEDDDWLGPVLPDQQKRRQQHTSQSTAKKSMQCVQGGQGGVEEEEWAEEDEQEVQLQQQRQKQEQACKPFSLKPSEAGLSGLCRVAVLPGGHLSGHLVDTRSRKCYGVMGTRVAVGGGGCRHDEDVEFLCLALLNFSTGREVPAAVVKTGGDMARMSPVEEGDLHRFPLLRLRLRTHQPRSRGHAHATGGGGCSVSQGVGEQTGEQTERGRLDDDDRGGHANGVGAAGDMAAQAGGVTAGGAAANAGAAAVGKNGGAEGEEEGSSGRQASGSSLLADDEGPLGIEQLMETRVHFVPSLLHAGPQAEQQLCSFAPRLRGRGAAVTVGTMRVDGQLPEGFV